MDKYLKERLLSFNDNTPNVYRDNWGSVLNFISDNRTVVNGEGFAPDQVFKLQMKVKEEEEAIAAGKDV